MFTRKEIVEIVTQMRMNEYSIMPRYHRPFELVFNFKRFFIHKINQDIRLSLTSTVQLKAFSLPKFVDESKYGKIDDTFTGTVLVKLISNNSVITTAYHRFKRAKIFDNHNTYCFYLETPAILYSENLYSVELSHHQAEWPTTFVVTKNEVNHVVMNPYRSIYAHGKYELRNSAFTTYFAALHFQRCSDYV